MSFRLRLVLFQLPGVLLKIIFLISQPNAQKNHFITYVGTPNQLSQ